MVRAHTGYTSYPHRGVNLEFPIEQSSRNHCVEHGDHLAFLFNPNVLSAKRVELLREIAPSAGSHCSPPRARRRRSPTSSTPPLWKPWAIRMCARGLPILDRKSRLVITRRRRHSVLSTRPKSRNGGRSSRRQTSRRNERLPQRSFSSRVAPTA
jgi:hypothetical protein